MPKARLLLPNSMYNRIRDKFPGKSKRELARELSNSIWAFYKEQKEQLPNHITSYIKPKKVGLGVMDKAMNGTPSNDTYNGCSLQVADLISMWLDKDISQTFVRYLNKHEPTISVRDCLTDHYKKVTFSKIEDLYEKAGKSHTSQPPVEIDVSTEVSKKIKRLESLSLINEESITKIEKIVHEKGEQQVTLDQVYVARDIEKDLKAFIDDSVDTGGGNFILITGDSGSGKSSLLWKTFNGLGKDPRFHTFLLTSYDLTDSHSWITLEYMEEIALHVDRFFNKRMVIFIDTLDIALHDASSIANMLVILQELISQGYWIIATSRVEEARLIPEYGHLAYKNFRLGSYSNTELPKAIEAYTAWYASYKHTYDIQQEVSRIMNLVDQGFPVKEVITNPLTLRMLFSVYAPFDIANEINVSNLLNLFWERRVESDQRIGLLKPVDKEDLSLLMGASALLMVTQGMPYLRYKTLKSELDKKGLPSGKISIAIARGLMKESNDVISFFHQSFFEFSAAKGFANVSDSFTLLKDFFYKTPDNLFLIPIYEQYLILSQHSLSIQPKLYSHLNNLLLSTHHALQIASLYVYIHLEAFELIEALDQQVLSFLLQNRQFIEYYLQQAVNVQNNRVPRLYMNLESIWETYSDKSTRFKVLHLINRFSNVLPEQTKAFFDDYDVCTYVTTHADKSDHAYNDLAQALVPLAAFNFNWVLTKYWYIQQHTSKDFYPHFTFYSGLYNLLRLNKIQIDKDVGTGAFIVQSYENGRPSDTKEIPLDVLKVLSPFWIWEFLNKQQSIESEIQGLINIENELHFSSKLYALSHFLASNQPFRGFLSMASLFDSLPRKFQNIWARTVLPEILGTPGTENQKVGKELIDFIQNKVIRVCTEEADINSTGLKMIYSGIKSAGYTKSQMYYHRILEISELQKPDYWLDQYKLGSFLAIGYWLKLDAALDAYKAILERSVRQYADVLRMFHGEFDNLIKESLIEAEEGYLVFRDTQDFHKMANVIDMQPPAFWEKHIKEIGLNTLYLLDSDKSQDRRLGLKIWLHLIDSLDSTQFNIDRLLALHDKETNSTNKQWILDLIVELSIRNKRWNVGHQIIQATWRSKEPTLIAKADSGYFKISIAEITEGKLTYDFDLLVERLFTRTSNIDYLTEFIQVLYALVRVSRVSEAKSILIKILTWDNFKSMGSKFTVKLTKRYYGIVSEVIEKLPQEELRDFIDLIEISPDKHIANMLVQGINRKPSNFTRFAKELKTLLTKDSVDTSTKQMINRYFALNSRIQGSQPWHELYEHI